VSENNRKKKERRQSKNRKVPRTPLIDVCTTGKKMVDILNQSILLTIPNPKFLIQTSSPKLTVLFKNQSLLFSLLHAITAEQKE
jgi:hypothetical protein